MCLPAAAAALRALAAAADAGPPPLDVKDPKAVALGYVEAAARVDRGRYPDFIPGSDCSSCVQLNGNAAGGFAPCALFPGKLVAVKGWCTAWAPQM